MNLKEFQKTIMSEKHIQTYDYITDKYGHEEKEELNELVLEIDRRKLENLVKELILSENQDLKIDKVYIKFRLKPIGLVS